MDAWRSGCGNPHSYEREEWNVSGCKHFLQVNTELIDADYQTQVKSSSQEDDSAALSEAVRHSIPMCCPHFLLHWWNQKLVELLVDLLDILLSKAYYCPVIKDQVRKQSI